MGQSAINKNAWMLNVCKTNYPQLLEELQQKSVINCTPIKHECNMIGEGCAAKIYLCKRLNVVFKINKGKIDSERFCKQIFLLNKAHSVWPGMFEQLVIDNDLIVGYSMKYFDGKKIWQAYCDPENIYHRNPSSRVRLAKKVKQEVKKLQKLQIGHGDLHIENILIRQPNKNKEDCQILIIDYGHAFIIEEYKVQKPQLTGWEFMKPSQAKTGKLYDASGLNAFMLGRVILQILMLQNYADYDNFREQSPEEKVKYLSQYGFDASVGKQIELYLDKNISVRNKMLFEESKMKQEIYQKPSQRNNTYENSANIKNGWSLMNFFQKTDSSSWNDNYYIRHPEKLGYQN